MREMRRKQSQLPQEEAWRILKECSYMTLATIDEDGSPYCVPLSPVLIEHNIYFHCAKEGQKLEGILRQPKVCISAVGFMQPVAGKHTITYESVIAAGWAEPVEDLEEKLNVLIELCLRYSPGMTREEVIDDCRKGADATQIIKIRVEELTAKKK